MPTRSVGTRGSDILFLVPTLLAVFAAVTVPRQRATVRLAPTDRGLAVRIYPLQTWMIPWADIRELSPTHLGWIGTVLYRRVAIAPFQFDRINRFIHPV